MRKAFFIIRLRRGIGEPGWSEPLAGDLAPL
jgi:hypothetical protein